MRQATARVVPQRCVQASGPGRRVKISGRHRGAVVPLSREVRQVQLAHIAERHRRAGWVLGVHSCVFSFRSCLRTAMRS